MKNSRLHLVLLALFGMSALAVNAAQLASAKVLSVSGTVNSHSVDGAEKQLIAGAILTKGDSVVTTALSNALLVFSNGSELVVEENTSISIAKLSQEAFSGNKSYEQLQADPSKSQALLQVNYGKVSGHVKKLRADSRFHIETPIGTAAIRGTQFSVGVNYNSERGEFVLTIHNKDGLVDVISRYSGSLEFGSGSVSEKGFDSGASDDVSDALPPRHRIIISLSKNDPNFDKIVHRLKNFPPFKNKGTKPEIIITPPGPVVTPEDVEEISANS